ncbi:MAG: hypothetical protein HRT44_08075 [Bdellovibrionales bacterium]|nr:hypothetical protein [Bdellovibrionales bacterium]NQZ19195.1 hypothetical protein [Bdellovibrionales bacterium]
MSLTRFWFVLLAFNIWLNLEPVSQWFEAQHDKTFHVNSEVCANDNITSRSSNKSLNSSFCVLIGLTSNTQDLDLSFNTMLNIPLAIEVLEPFFLLSLNRTFSFGSPMGRAPPQA